MNTKFVSIVVAFVIVGALLIFQATRSGASPVLTPSELVKGSDLLRVRVVGRVTDTPFEYTTEPKARLDFSIQDPASINQSSVRVVYYGIKPDMFAAGRDVIIDGDYKGGVVNAASLLTQCPSKYVPPDPGQKGSYE